jgi:hypothetical protein
MILRNDFPAYLMGLNSLWLLIIRHRTYLVALHYASMLYCTYIRTKNVVGNSNRDTSQLTRAQ